MHEKGNESEDDVLFLSLFLHSALMLSCWGEEGGEGIGEDRTGWDACEVFFRFLHALHRFETLGQFFCD